jgi:hypothetical protein
LRRRGQGYRHSMDAVTRDLLALRRDEGSALLFVGLRGDF